MYMYMYIRICIYMYKYIYMYPNEFNVILGKDILNVLMPNSKEATVLTIDKYFNVNC